MVYYTDRQVYVKRKTIIMKMFVDAFGAMGHFCVDNIRQRKRLPEKMVIEVEVK
jgi:hypothetical protein